MRDNLIEKEGETMAAIKSRIFNLMQYVEHPVTGEALIDENQIIDGISKRTIKRWAYVLHDKDVYTEEEEVAAASEHVKAGERKHPHYHVVVETGTNQVEIGVIARWFGVPENFVQIAKGRGAFLDCVRYLTHESDKEQERGKHLYANEEIKANFSWREELDKRERNKLRYGSDLTPKERMRRDVLEHGKTLRECMKEDPDLYIADLDKLQKLRMQHLTHKKPPKARMNYYVYGGGGVGKGLMSRGIALMMYRGMEPEDVYFEVGSKNALLEGYDGQPVIIWHDMRAGELLSALGGRGNVFNVFDTFPSGQRQNIKYGSVRLTNEINIVNGVDDYQTFLDGLAGEYVDRSGNAYKSEDKNQSYRRFPMIIPIRQDDFDLYINKGFAQDTDDYEQYIAYKNITGSLKKIVEAAGLSDESKRQLTETTLRLITEKSEELREKLNREPTEEEIQEQLYEFENYGLMPEEIRKREDELYEEYLRLEGEIE